MKYLTLLVVLLPSLAFGEQPIGQCFFANPYFKHCSAGKPKQIEECLNTMLTRLETSLADVHSSISQGLAKSPEFEKEFGNNYTRRVEELKIECAQNHPRCYAEEAALQSVICRIDGTVAHLEDLNSSGNWRGRAEEIIHGKTVVIDERDASSAWTKLLPQ